MKFKRHGVVCECWNFELYLTLVSVIDAEWEGYNQDASYLVYILYCPLCNKAYKSTASLNQCIYRCQNGLSPIEVNSNEQTTE